MSTRANTKCPFLRMMIFLGVIRSAVGSISFLEQSNLILKPLHRAMGVDNKQPQSTSRGPCAHTQDGPPIFVECRSVPFPVRQCNSVSSSSLPGAFVNLPVEAFKSRGIAGCRSIHSPAYPICRTMSSCRPRGGTSVGKLPVHVARPLGHSAVAHFNHPIKLSQMVATTGASSSIDSRPWVIILGGGWVGSRLAAKLEAEGERVLVTNREMPPTVKASYFQPVPLKDSISRVRFNSSQPETWKELPPPHTVKSVIVTFSMTQDFAQQFHEAYLAGVPHVICYSSTGVYEVSAPGQVVDEQTPMKPRQRALAEEYLRHRGATVLALSGIFGESRGERGICLCLSQYSASGAPQNGLKIVNMVHIRDILTATHWFHKNADAAAGERINIGGESFLLKDLVRHCGSPHMDDMPHDKSSKHVSSQKLLSYLPEAYTFRQPLSWDEDEDDSQVLEMDIRSLVEQ